MVVKVIQVEPWNSGTFDSGIWNSALSHVVQADQA